MTELPFELNKRHKSTTKSSWKKYGLIVTEEEFESIYYMYIYATNCELCNKEFPNTQDRSMDHDHETGEFRNIVCNKCNTLKADRNQSNNTSGYIGISKHYGKTYKQGFTWVFRVTINEKRKRIKSSVDYDKLVKFAENWKKENLYYT
jgi:hypothetical protein